MTEPKNEEILQLNPIRIETALSRYPIHRLARKGNVSIELREENENGETAFKWEVSYNSKYGQPGPLAYKLDSLVINRKIEEAERPLPKIIELGSLRGIAEEACHTGDTNRIKKALYQNASAFITAKMRYKGKDKAERTKEFGNTRYGVVFTGETLPDGRIADAVCIVLNDWYRNILDTAEVRPLDYDYLKELPPAAQRLYELASFQIFPALLHGRPRAKYLYSDFCTYAPQTRYFDFEHVKKQMYKVHAPHKKSGYISAIELRETTDGEGQPDWEMLYTPGRRAKAEFKEATRKSRTVERQRVMPPLLTPARIEPEPAATPIYEATPEDEPLVTRLMSFHIAEPTARELVRDYRRAVELQLRALPYRNLNKIRDLASWLVVAVKENHQLPEPIIEALAKEEEARKAKAKREAEEARKKRREALQPAYYERLKVRDGELQKEQPETYQNFLAKSAEGRREIENNRLYKPQLKERLLTNFDHEESYLERLRDYFKEPTLDEWIVLNADKFDS